MKRGTILIIGTAVAFLLTVAFLLSSNTPIRQAPVGKEAFQVYEDTRVAEKVNYYVIQSLRNAGYLALQDLQREGFFQQQLGDKVCPSVQGKILLFTDTSCTYTQKTLETYYLSFVQQRFAAFFTSPLYGLRLDPNLFPFSLTLAAGKPLQLSGKSKQPLTYTGKRVTYSFPVTYQESLPYDLHHFFTLLDSVKTNISCIKEFAAQPDGPTDTTFGQELLQRCSFSSLFTWTIEKQGDLVFFTATTKDPVLFLDNLSFAFAISLNNLHAAQQETSLF